VSSCKVVTGSSLSDVLRLVVLIVCAQATHTVRRGMRRYGYELSPRRASAVKMTDVGVRRCLRLTPLRVSTRAGTGCVALTREKRWFAAQRPFRSGSRIVTGRRIGRCIGATSGRDVDASGCRRARRLSCASACRLAAAVRRTDRSYVLRGRSCGEPTQAATSLLRS